MDLNQETIKIIKNYFAQQPVLVVYLFGSRAKGTSHTNSDIDLLVELDYSQKIGLAFIDMQLDLEYILNQKVDVVSAQGLSKYIQPFIHREKIKIYERQSSSKH